MLGGYGNRSIKGYLRLGRRDEGLSSGVFCFKLLCFRPGPAAVKSGNVPLVWAYGNDFTEMK